jgi:hypothetical protein
VAVARFFKRNLPVPPTVASDNPRFDPERIAMSTRFQIAALVFMMTNAIAFGIGVPSGMRLEFGWRILR